MYFPVGWPKHLKLPQNDPTNLQHVISNRDRTLFAVLTEDSFSLWYCKPSVQIVCYRQSPKQTHNVGVFQQAEWKPDSSAVAIITSKNIVLFFSVDLDVSAPNHHCLYVQKEHKNQSNDALISNHFINDTVPAVNIEYQTQVQISSPITRIITLLDEIVLSLTNGQLQRVQWDGSILTDGTLSISDISLSFDLQYSRVSHFEDEHLYVVDMEYSPMLGGFSIVLSNGKAILLLSPSTKTPHAIWVPELTNATCVAVNHKYRLVAFGCSNGEGVVYTIDDMIGALQVSHRLQVSSKDYPDAGQFAGHVSRLCWTPDGTAIALCWQKGAMSLWSVFGALLVCTLSSNFGFSDQTSLYPPSVKALEWGMEGYHLWLVCDEEKQHTENSHSPPHILQFSYVKSALTVNPCMTSHEHLFLQGEDKLYLNTGEPIWNTSSPPLLRTPQNTPQTTPHRTTSYREVKHDMNSMNSQGLHALIGNKQWQLLPVSHNYLASNWPIRYVSVDRSGHCVAVAGRTGLAHYAFFSRRWKLFGNETQEKDMTVSGGMTWWKDFICVACYNIPDHGDEIRCYPRSSKLDNTFATVVKVPSQVLLLNTLKNILIAFCADCHVMLFSMERKSTQPNPSLTVSKIQEVSLGNFIPHPVCVTGLMLTSLRTDSGVSQQDSSQEAESILLNVAGKLLMLQRDRSGPQIKDTDDNQSYRPVPFCAPSVVATSVENMWTTARSHNGKKQLMEALWLGCGAQGMKVWLPLYPREGSKTHNFMSKRIMLPFKIDIYPLAVLFEDVVILGAASDVMMFDLSSPNPIIKEQHVSYAILERTSQIYFHHILRQMLRRNLGVHALGIARCCTELPYFSHILELLLHEVLEAEATSKDPIPDPLLPRVTAFIQEFPEFLQTVVHCARKTEVALWPYLFNTVGNPKDLFEECLITGQLETAASYLIILQNLEKPIISRQHATLLLDSTLASGHWELSRDLVRFLKAIDPSEAESLPTAHLVRAASTSAYAGPYTNPPLSPTDSQVSFSYAMGRIRTPSGSYTDTGKDVAIPRQKEKVRHSKSSDSLPQRRLSRPDDRGSVEQFYIDVILCRHARRLLCAQNLRDLCFFSANIEGFSLVTWLKKERLRSARVEDFVSALQKIHHDFQWPFPMLNYAMFNMNCKAMTAMSSTPSSAMSLASVDGASSSFNESPPAFSESPPPPPYMNGSSGSQEVILHRLASYSKNLGSAVSVQTSSDAFMDLEHSDVFLRPSPTKDNGSMTTLEQSDTSSIPGGESDLMADGSISGDRLLSVELEELSMELVNKGPAQSELELRYLLQILLEASCLEWSLIIAIVLRDGMAVVRTVNTASLTDTPLEIVGRMREGLSYLELWAETECVGYKSFLQRIHSQTDILNKIAEQTPPKCKMSRSSSVDSNHGGSPSEDAFASVPLSAAPGEDDDLGISALHLREEKGSEVVEAEKTNSTCSVS